MKKVLFFLGALSARDMEWLSDNGQKIVVEKQHVLISKCEEVRYLFIILSGEVILYKDEEYKESIIRLGMGEVLGEMTFIESQLPTVSAVTDSTCEVFAISLSKIKDKMIEDSEFKGNFYYSLALFLSNRLRKTTYQLGFNDEYSEDILDLNVMDNISQAGANFSYLLQKFS